MIGFRGGPDPLGKLELVRGESFPGVERLAQGQDPAPRPQGLLPPEIPPSGPGDQVGDGRGSGGHGIKRTETGGVQELVVTASDGMQRERALPGSPQRGVRSNRGALGQHAGNLAVHVVRGIGVGDVRRAERRGYPRVVVGQALAADGDGVPLGPLADPLGRLPGPVGQHRAEPIPPGDLFHQLDDGVGVSPGEIQPVGVLPADQPPFVALHRHGDRAPDPDGIDAVAVAEVVGLDHRLQVVVHQHPAQGGQ